MELEANLKTIDNAKKSIKLTTASGTVGNRTRSTSFSCYQLMESMPIPEPTWSTTAPTVMFSPIPSMENLEFEWPENMSSSYTWWIGFLNSLDGKVSTELMVESSIGRDDSISSVVEKSYLDGSNDQTQFLDEWLIFPAAEDHFG